MRGISSVRRPPETSVLRGVVVTIALLQTVALGVLAQRGSWLSDDLTFLEQGSRGFAPAELLTPVNDHIAPGLRFVYAVFAEIAPLNHGLTIGWRMLMQALAILLMGVLLMRVIGPSWWVAIGTVYYAVTPLSMPSFMSLSSGVNNLNAHVFGLLLLHATIDWHGNHRRRALVYGPLALLISLACWEKSVLVVVTAVALAEYVRGDSRRRWLRHGWPFAAVNGVAIVAFGIVYVAFGDPSSGQPPSAPQVLDLVARSFEVPLSSLVGGPWHWAASGQPFSFAAPPVAAIVAGAVAAATLLLVAWKRDRRALWMWCAVGVYVLATTLVVSYGRFDTFGASFSVHYHYWSDLSIPLTLAIVLSARTVPVAVPAVATACLMIGVVVSDAGFAVAWGKNPAKPYFAAVRMELDLAGPNVNLWDTQMPQPIGTALMPDSRLSAVLRMARIPFRLQAPGSEPLLVDDSGAVRPAAFATWSRGEPASRANSFCNLLLRGTEPLRIPLTPTQNKVAGAEWYARASYFSNRENQVSVELVDADGAIAAMPTAGWPAGAGTMYLGPSRRIRATAVQLHSTDPATNLCVERIEIGIPR
ncbi:hypothetical protein [Kribbella sp. NPDC004536]|uniref:hypothetical protein n=1 Tax=Kribbella sp. NPDC004536 TaxID=3364106 RepID=UPI00368331B0